MLILWTLFYKNIEIDFVETQLLMWLKAAWQCVMRYSGCWCVCSESAGWRWQHGRRRQTHYWYPWSRQCASVSQHTAAGDGRRCLHWRLSSRSMLCCHWEMFCLSVDSLLYVVWLTDLLLFTASQTWDDLFDWLCRKWLSESFHSDLRHWRVTDWSTRWLAGWVTNCCSTCLQLSASLAAWTCAEDSTSIGSF